MSPTLVQKVVRIFVFQLLPWGTPKTVYGPELNVTACLSFWILVTSFHWSFASLLLLVLGPCRIFMPLPHLCK